MYCNNLGTDSFPLAEIVSDGVLIKTSQDALDVMAEVGFSNMVLRTYHFEPDFFDLSSRKLGDILQKWTNYGVKVAIIGYFTTYPSKVLKQFISESNRANQYLFVSNLEVVKRRWLGSSKHNNQNIQT